MEFEDYDGNKLKLKNLSTQAENNSGFVEFTFPRYSTILNTGLLKKIKIICSPENVNYLFIERSAFSRLTVKNQLPFLSKY